MMIVEKRSCLTDQAGAFTLQHLGENYVRISASASRQDADFHPSPSRQLSRM